MYREYKVLKGSEIRGSQLRLPRAIAIHKAALLHPCVTVNSCSRNTADAEIIILTLHRLSIPDEPVYPIQEVEEVAVICTKEDLSLPEVYALRKDFPVGLPHSNARAFEHPVSLCISDVPFSDFRHQFNAYDYINYIINWFNRNSLGLLHEKDRPLEVFFQFNKICTFKNIQSVDTCYGLYTELSKLTSTLEFVSKNKATHYIVNIPTNSNVSKNMACLPKTIGELADISSVIGKSVPDTILQTLVSTVAGKTQLPLLILLYIPSKRMARGKDERIDLFLVRITPKARDIRHKYGILAPENFKKWFNEIPIEIIFTVEPVARQYNALFNAKDLLYKKLVVVGAGTLGSNILDSFVREGISEEVVFLDFDYLLPHNVARHILPPNVVMHSKVKALENHYSGIIDQKITAIEEDMLRLSENDKKSIYKDTNLIVDASTSVAVERKIAFEPYSEKYRCCTVFLNPKGNELVMLMEDKARTQRLDLLEMSYQRNLIIRPELSSHLEIADQQRTNSFSCRSISSILDYDNVGILAGIASQQIQKASKRDDCSLCIWRVDGQDSTVSKISLNISKWKQYKSEDIQVYLANDVQNEMENQKRQSHDKETGGCLFGCYDKDRRIIYVLYMHPAPCDSQSTPASFIRGCEGLSQVKNEISRKTYHQVAYLGEWHSHPNGNCAPSSTDKEQFRQMSDWLEQEDLPFVQAISGNDGIYINAKI